MKKILEASKFKLRLEEEENTLKKLGNVKDLSPDEFKEFAKRSLKVAVLTRRFNEKYKTTLKRCFV